MSQSPSNSPRFSLATLFAVVTFCAIACGLIARFGIVAAFSVLLALLLIPVAILSIRADKVVPFWQCIGSLTIPLFLLPSLSHQQPHDPAVVMGAILVATGISLALAAVLRGHWSTKLLASVPLSGYLVAVYFVVRDGISHWDRVVQYWSC